MSTRREALEQQFEGLQAEEIQNTPPPEVEVKPEPARDHAGRFASKAVEVEAPAASPQEPVAAVAETASIEQPKPRPNPPSSWKPEKRAKWDTLDPEVAEYINQREEETNRGVEPLKKVWHEVSPFLQGIQSSGTTPEVVVRDLLHTWRALTTGDPQTRQQVLSNIARIAGVQMGDQPQGEVDPVTAHLRQELQQLQGTVSTWQQQAEQAAQQQAQQMIAEFSKDKPHFEAVKTKMGELIQKGFAPDLDTAYKLAIRFDDQIFEQAQAQQRDAQEQSKRSAADAAAKAAKANAVSPRSATPGAAPAVTATAKGRRAALEQAVEQHSAGRI